MPLEPNGSATVLIIDHLVAPSAYAAWIRSNGVWENISLATEVTIGMIMMASTRPATNGERSKNGSLTSKKGIQPKYLCSSFAQYIAIGISTK